MITGAAPNKTIPLPPRYASRRRRRLLLRRHTLHIRMPSGKHGESNTNASVRETRGGSCCFNLSAGRGGAQGACAQVRAPRHCPTHMWEAAATHTQ